MDLLFSSKKAFVWDMEKDFAQAKAENSQLQHVAVAEKVAEKATTEEVE